MKVNPSFGPRDGNLEHKNAPIPDHWLTFDQGALIQYHREFASRLFPLRVSHFRAWKYHSLMMHQVAYDTVKDY